MKEKFNILYLILLPSIIFYFEIYFIIKNDALIINSFNLIFFNISNEELSILCLSINLITYSYIFFMLIKTKLRCIINKFNIFEHIFFTSIIIMIVLLMLLFISDDKLNTNIIDVLYLLFISFFIFSFNILTSISILILTKKQHSNNVF